MASPPPRAVIPSRNSSAIVIVEAGDRRVLVRGAVVVILISLRCDHPSGGLLTTGEEVTFLPVPSVTTVCFSAGADIVAGAVVTGIGLDTLRHVRHRRESALALLPILFGIHQLIEVAVWWGVEGRVSPQVMNRAAWLYLIIAFGVIPWLVPHAVRQAELDPQRRVVMAPLVALGGMVALALSVPVFIGPVAVTDGGLHLSYSVDLVFGGFLTVSYVVATCGALLLSSDRAVAWYGAVNLVAVIVLASLLTSAVISLWCVWAAVTSVAIAIHLRRLDRQTIAVPA